MKLCRHHKAIEIVFLLLVCFDSAAQQAAYFELLGNGGLYSLNYERKFSNAFGARAGFSFYNTEDKTQGFKEDVFTAPVLINYYLSGDKRNYFEVGGGFVFGNEKKIYSNGEVKNQAINSATAFIGYRHQKGKEGFLWRIGLVPLYSLPNGDFWLSAGLGLGYHF